MGGHSVPEETVRRRFAAGLRNFFQLYIPIADSWQMYDNTDINNLKQIASKLGDKIEIQNPEIWVNLKETYNESSKK